MTWRAPSTRSPTTRPTAGGSPRPHSSTSAGERGRPRWAASQTATGWRSAPACRARRGVLREATPVVGLDPAFRPRAGVRRGDHVLYAGSLGRGMEVATLLAVAARSRDAWPLCFIGAGRAQRVIAARAKKLHIAHRVSQRPPIGDPDALARLYARAACVVAPAGGVEAIEAAASGARVVVAAGSE